MSMQEPQEMWVRSLCQEDPLGWEMAIHSSILGKSHGHGLWAAIGGVTKSWTQLSMHVCTYNDLEIIQRPRGVK